ncbi:MAG TPA: hypothetical protein VG498_10675 [Terriglobales bacterium]|nr:hypothetical protein [Terriglobales bacterium]
MASDEKGSSQLEFLNSWKEIANYMGRGVRTVQRYEAQFGLPVRRPAGKSRSSVIATRAEIDAWVAAAPYRETYLLSKARENGRNDVTMEAVKTGLEEMKKLRDHMIELRSETSVALNLFLNSLQSLHIAMNRTFSADSGGLVDLPLVRGGAAKLWIEDNPVDGFTRTTAKPQPPLGQRKPNKSFKSAANQNYEYD